jgi:putative ABC transport system permease protein
MSLDLTIKGYNEGTGYLFYESLIRQLESVPGVISASFAKTVPPNDWSDSQYVFQEGTEPPQEVLRGEPDLGTKTDVNRIAPHYFQTLNIPLLNGREFTEADKRGSTLVAIVNEKLAEKLWPGENPIGKLLHAPFYNQPPRPPVEIIGIAKDTRHRTLLATPPPILYLPVLQAYDGRTTLVIHTAGEPASMVHIIRDEVAKIDTSLPLFAIKSLSEQVSITLWQQRMAAGLIGIFGGLALLLAAIGIYGVISHSVALRTREIGIRMALGAGSSNIVALVVRKGLMLAISGVAVGTAAAFFLTGLMSSLLYDVSTTDSITFVIVSLTLIVVALLASYIPARKATRVDPIIALRHE